MKNENVGTNYEFDHLDHLMPKSLFFEKENVDLIGNKQLLYSK
jgi:hypothetical protein